MMLAAEDVELVQDLARLYGETRNPEKACERSVTSGRSAERGSGKTELLRAKLLSNPAYRRCTRFATRPGLQNIEIQPQ